MKQILLNQYTKYDFSQKQIDNIHQHLTNMVHRDLNDEYVVVSTPTDISILGRDDVVIRIDAKKYSVPELLTIIEKAAKFDAQ